MPHPVLIFILRLDNADMSAQSSQFKIFSLTQGDFLVAHFQNNPAILILLAIIGAHIIIDLQLDNLLGSTTDMIGLYLFFAPASENKKRL